MNLLTEPVLSVRTAQGDIVQAGLTDVITRLLTEGQDLVFLRLAAEQYGYWWRFLVRCGAKALRDASLTVEEAAGRGNEVLAAELTGALADAAGGPGAWELYQADPAIPAFVQPPTPTGSAPDDSQEKYKEYTPSLLTSVVGTKNHERKIDLARVLHPDELVYALVEHQLGSIFGGRGRYASQIMGSASGAGSGTPFMGVRLGNDGMTYRHDVSVLLDSWDEIRAEKKLQGDVWALWTEPWNGQTPLPAERLDPAFIPMARLIRMDAPRADGAFDTVWFRSSTAARVDDHTQGGDFGDLFTPLVPKGPGYKVRGTLDRGYNYAEIVQLLGWDDSGSVPAPSVEAVLNQKELDHDDEITLLFMGTSFHQGKTGGFHQRRVLMRAGRLRLALREPAPLREAHDQLSGTLRDAMSALRGAMRFLLAGSPRPRTGDEDKVDAPARALDTRADAAYVAALLDAGGRHAEGDLGYVEEWAEQVREWALNAFEAGRASIPIKVSQRWEREVRAGAWLRWKLKQMRGTPETREEAAVAEEAIVE